MIDRDLIRICGMIQDDYPMLKGQARHQMRRVLETAIGIGVIEGSPVESVELVTFDDEPGDYDYDFEGGRP